MHTFQPFVLTACLMLTLAGGLRAQDRIPWVTDLRVARQAAEQQHRLVLLHFWSETCPPCQKLERSVFNQPEFIRVASTGFVPVKINMQESPELASYYKITAIPTDVIVDPNGKEIFRGTSPDNANAYIAMLDSVRAHHNVGQSVPAGSFATVPRSAASQPWQVPGVAAAGHDPSATAPPASNGLASAGLNGSAPAARAPAETTRPAYLENPYSNPLYREQPQQPINAYVPRYGNAAEAAGQSAASATTESRPWQPATPSPAPSPASPVGPGAGTADRLSTTLPAFGPARPEAAPSGSPYGNLAGGSAATGGDRAGNPQAPWNSPASYDRAAENPLANQPLGGNPALDPRLAERAPQPTVPPAAAPGQPPIAMDGFCPVTLVEQSKWNKGDARWGAFHRGRVYLFSSQQAQQQFLAQPDRFSPILAGHDAVRFAETGQFVEGKREHGVYYRDRILLFADEDTLQRFGTRPDYYVSAAEQASMARTVGAP